MLFFVRLLIKNNNKNRMSHPSFKSFLKFHKKKEKGKLLNIKIIIISPGIALSKPHYVSIEAYKNTANFNFHKIALRLKPWPTTFSVKWAKEIEFLKCCWYSPGAYSPQVHKSVVTLTEVTLIRLFSDFFFSFFWWIRPIRGTAAQFILFLFLSFVWN